MAAVSSLIWTRLGNGIFWPAELIQEENGIADDFLPDSKNLRVARLFDISKFISVDTSDLSSIKPFECGNVIQQTIPAKIEENYNRAIAAINYAYEAAMSDRRHENEIEPSIISEYDTGNTYAVSDSSCPKQSSCRCLEYTHENICTCHPSFAPIIPEMPSPPTNSLEFRKNTKRDNVIIWDDYFMAVAFLSAMRSKDPNTQVGACIVNPDQRIVGIGYNGFPRGCSDDELPWAKEADDELDTKYPYVCHAEVNAILNKNSADVRGCKMYVALFPCNDCAKIIIQSGIVEVVYLCDKYHDKPTFRASRRMLDMAKSENY
eukprot:gene5349-10696_t